MLYFLRLTRPVNLVVIAITMYGFGWYLEAQIVEARELGIGTFEFFILVFSTVLIAAAGNIINDYFDIRADRINKPEKQIIGKYIKKRVAIVTHWGINLLAFLMAVYLSIRLQTFWYVFIHLLSINLLWYYSTYFKRKFLIGNVLIAGLTAMVPLLVGLYYYLHDGVIWQTGNQLYPFDWNHPGTLIYMLSIGLACFAFMLNLSREIAKDIQDIEGDRVLSARTIPIVWGTKNSGLLLLFFLVLAASGVVFVGIYFPFTDQLAIIPLIGALLFLSCAILVTVTGINSDNAGKVNLCLKLAMISGTISPIWWQILMIYG